MIKYAISRFLKGVAGADQAMAEDPFFNVQVRVLGQMLDVMALAMEDEGVPTSVRERVVRSVLYGCMPHTLESERAQYLQKQILDGIEKFPGFLIP